MGSGHGGAGGLVRSSFLLLRSVQTCRRSISSAGTAASDRVACNDMITRLGRCGRIRDAQDLFDAMPHRDVITHTALLTAYADCGDADAARAVFDAMPLRNTHSWNAMVSAYLRASRFADARALFLAMPAKNEVSYAAMISGLAKAGMVGAAAEVLRNTPPHLRDPFASNALINGYLRVGKLDSAVKVFEEMRRRNAFSWCMMVDGLAKSGRVSDARKVFDGMPKRNVVSWTSMIAGYFKAGMHRDGFRLFLEMRRSSGGEVNATTLSVLVDGCRRLCRTAEGTQIHAVVITTGFDSDTVLGNSLITMYSRFGQMSDARRAFESLPGRDAVSWNSLISGLIQQNAVEEAFAVFESMPVPVRDVVSWTSMIKGFADRGMLAECVRLFEQMPWKDEFAWTMLVSAFLSNGDCRSTVRWACRMAQDGFRPNAITLSCLLSAWGSLSALRPGKRGHAYAVTAGVASNDVVQSSLVTMYAKCGALAEAGRIFGGILNPTLVVYNSMITATARHGSGADAMPLFLRLQRDGHSPNDVTFLGLLTACARSGNVEDGRKYFNLMSSGYSLEPKPEHYACMVDLLGRVGRLQEALEFISAADPWNQTADAWSALANAGKLHADARTVALAAHRKTMALKEKMRMVMHHETNP